MSRLYRQKIKIITTLLTISIIAGVWVNKHTASAGVQDEINARQKQIQELEKQVEDYQQKIDQNRGQALTLQNTINTLNDQIQKIQLEIRSLALSIDVTTSGINQTSDQIQTTIVRIDKLKSSLAELIRLINYGDNVNLLEILLRHDSLSEFFNNFDSIKDSQEKVKLTVQNLKQLKSDLEDKKSQLEDQKQEQLKLKQIQEIQKRNLADSRKEKDNLLKETRNQEVRFQKLIEVSRKDIERIKNQITFLIQQGVTVEDAIRYGQLAAVTIGIRPAFLIAILEIESALGQNVGKGNWIDDMYNCYLRLGRRERAESEKAALLEIVGKLNLDINSIKVSKEPYYGCGGALGPAQFIPTTWLGYEEEVARLTRHVPPNPFNIGDAFMAAAIKLGKGGATAKDTTGEIRAAKAYVSGSPSCTKRICNHYANLVLDKAAEIEKSLPSQ